MRLLTAALPFLLLFACTSLRVDKETRAPASAGRGSVNTLHDDSARFVLPTPKETRDGAGFFTPGTVTRIEHVGIGNDRSAIDLLTNELLAKSATGTGSGTIVLEKLSDWSALGRDLGPEGYVLDVTSDGVKARATGNDGLFYAVQTLLQLVDPSSGRIHSVHIVDWPEVNDRMVLYDLRFDQFDLAYMKRWVHELSRAKINQVMLFLSGDYRYEKYPFVGSPEKLTREKLREFVSYARDHHVRVVPQVESLGHADGALWHEEFRDIRLGPNNTYAYSPCTPRTYDVLGDFYRELTAETPQTDLFHVGGDEVWGFDGDPRCAATSDEASQSAVYSRHMQKLSSMLKPLGRRMAIWSDMILKHPAAATNVPRDTVIFDWDYSEDYKRFDDFPSLKIFKDLGFRNIYATPAVLGFNDMYPLLPVAFQNIRGFTQAALREDIRSVCVTTWETQPGNNAENYLYGLVWAGNVTWNSQATSLADYNRRYAADWFGIRDDAAAAHVDRALWFPWRVSGSSILTEKDSQGFWQIEHRTADLLYMNPEKFAAAHTLKELRQLPEESEQLLHSLDTAVVSINWLRDHDRRNPMTVQSMEMTNAFYRFLAHKAHALSRLALNYGDAFAAGDSPRADHALEQGLRDLALLGRRFPGLKRHLTRAMKDRNRGHEELATLAESRRALHSYVKSLTSARDSLSRGEKMPSPMELGLAPAAETGR